jgi:XTP/dITP diphosphohydrolase
MKICFASNNPHKLKEVRDKLGDEFEIVSLKDLGCTEDIAETGDTLAENSLIKAQYIFDKFGISCFADDTGLEVAALNGKPGVKSARYASENATSQENIDKLLHQMKDKTQREAQFRTIMTLILNGEILQFEGKVEGQILEEERGKDGFGYDSLFLPTGETLTFAQMPLDKKNNMSHRSNALKKLVDYLISH